VPWDYPTMTITADNKKRVVIPWARPGDVFDCVRQDEDHISLARFQPPPPLKKRSRAQVRRALKHSKLTFDMTWSELRSMTREP
jgi:hypothetical protein